MSSGLLKNKSIFSRIVDETEQKLANLYLQNSAKRSFSLIYESSLTACEVQLKILILMLKTDFMTRYVTSIKKDTTLSTVSS